MREQRSGRLEGRPGARGAGAECAVSHPRPGPRGDAGAFRDHQEPAGLLMTETIQLGDIVDRGDAQGHQECPPVGASAGRPRDAGRAQGDAPGSGPRLRDLQARLDSRAAGEAARTGAGNAAAVHRAGEPLPLGAALPAVCRRARKPSPSSRSTTDASRSPCAPAATQAKRAAGHARVAQVAAARGGPAADPKVGAEAGSEGCRLFPAADEDQVGKLQPPGADTSASTPSW